jgi:pimeloyl-ACP methyl ester carboxylesterase
MVPGGATDADIFARIAGLLADRYTVVTNDPRGNSRSRLDGPPEEWRADVHRDDAVRLLAAIGTEPAFVFADSGGAQVGLDPAAHYPDTVRTLIAHEPPAAELLPDVAQRRALLQEVYDTYRREGVGPAMQKCLAAARLEGGPSPAAAEPQGAPTTEMLDLIARLEMNFQLLFAHGVWQIIGYVPDIATLRAGAPQIVVAVGDASRGQLAHQAGVALAERLGSKVVHFPGGPGGYTTHPGAYAETLHKVLRGH